MNIDTARIHAKGGKGGNGCISFRREKFVPLATVPMEAGAEGASFLKQRKEWAR